MLDGHQHAIGIGVERIFFGQTMLAYALLYKISVPGEQDLFTLSFVQSPLQDQPDDLMISFPGKNGRRSCTAANFNKYKKKGLPATFYVSPAIRFSDHLFGSLGHKIFLNSSNL